MAYRYRLTVTGPEGDEHTEPIPSVTQILDKVLAKTGLPDWYYKQAVSGFSLLLSKYGENIPTDVRSLHSLMKNEGHSPYAIRDLAAGTGSDIHRAVNQLAKGKRVLVRKAWPELATWWEGKGFRASHILGAETLLWNAAEGYAGTCDLVYTPNTELMEMGGEHVLAPKDIPVVLADIKSGQPRESHAVQLELYRWAWESMGKPKISRMQIVQVPRDGSMVIEHEVPISPELTEAAKGILSVWRWLS